MMPTILAALRKALNDDSALGTLLGGKRVYLGWLTEKMTIPCVTITENSERSTPRPCHASGRHRDNSSVVQIDIWIDRTDDEPPSTVEDVETIVSRIDELLFVTGVTNTRGWSRVSSSGPHQEDDLLHKALRYEFAYSVKD